MKKRKRIIITAVLVLFVIGVVGVATVFGINAYVKGSVADRIVTSEQAAQIEDVD